MQGDKKEFFDVVNKAWGILLPHVENPEEYKKAMSDLFRLFMKPVPDKFSDKWWQETIDAFFDYEKTYKGNPIRDFVGELAMGMLNYREYEYKKKDSSLDVFYEKIVGAFEREVKRLKGG